MALVRPGNESPYPTEARGTVAFLGRSLYQNPHGEFVMMRPFDNNYTLEGRFNIFGEASARRRNSTVSLQGTLEYMEGIDYKQREVKVFHVGDASFVHCEDLETFMRRVQHVLQGYDCKELPDVIVEKLHDIVIRGFNASNLWADGLKGINVQDRPENRKQTALILWMAGSSADVELWIRNGVIPITSWTSPQKGRCVSFRDSPLRAAERHQLRCRTENKPFSKEEIRLLEIRLDSEAYVMMSTEKIIELGCGWVTRLRYETYPESPEDRGVWYYFGKSFDLSASGVSYFGPMKIW